MFNSKVYEEHNHEKKEAMNRYFVKVDLANNLNEVVSGPLSNFDAEYKQMEANRIVQKNDLMPQLHEEALNKNAKYK